MKRLSDAFQAMHFLIHKRRNTPTIIIVALVDVLIVLLIFLMVTTTFKQQSALKVTLPESSQAKKSGANENPPFVVSIDTNGVYYLGKVPKTYEQLKGELVSQAAKNPKLILAIDADEKAPWGKVVKIRDAAAEAKIKTLVAYTKEAGKP
jgi:biopolymer transport protein ExbD